jgi:2-aminoethylphosphonate-pyruvate transaminase
MFECERDQPILLTPGPVSTSPRVRRALASANFSHREPAFSRLYERVGRALTRVAGASRHEPLIVCGSGTAATEAALASLISGRQTLLVLSNGAFGERLAEIARVVGIPVRLLQYGWAEPMIPDDVRRIVADDPDIGAVAMVHHETSTGCVNPVDEIGQVLRSTRAKFFVDVVSSLGCEPFDADASNVAVVIGTANKCLHAVPGVSFVLVRDDMWAADVSPRSLYFDLRRYRPVRPGDVRIPFTPAVHALAALDEALRELDDDGGVPARMRHYQALNGRLRAGLPEHGIQTCFGARRRSCSLTVAALPSGQTSDELYDALLDRGFVVYHAKGNLRERCVLVANMGYLQVETIDRFLDAVAAVVPAGTR